VIQPYERHPGAIAGHPEWGVPLLCQHHVKEAAVSLTILDGATISELIGVSFTSGPTAEGLSPQQHTEAERTGPYCERHDCARVLCWQQHPDAEEVFAWVQRTFPEADEHDKYSFAELIATTATGLGGGWGALDDGRPRDVAAYQVLHRAHGEAGGSYEDWTREMFRRLVDYYFHGQPL
jgi:hypothetical protein